MRVVVYHGILKLVTKECGFKYPMLITFNSKSIKPLMVYLICGLLLLGKYQIVFANPNKNQISQNSVTKTVATGNINTYICNPNCYGKGFWTGLWGTPAPEFRMNLGMWSVHATDKKRNNRNDLFGFSYKSFFLGTLVNSFSKRAYAVGIQRYWLMRPLSKDSNYEIGYRLGLVSGYKGHNILGPDAFKNAAVIPFVQLVAGINWKFIGFEISTPDPYVISAGFYIRF